VETEAEPVAAKEGVGSAVGVLALGVLKAVVMAMEGLVAVGMALAETETVEVGARVAT